MRAKGLVSVAGRLAPADAVRALTLSAAEIYGVADRLGSIEKGKIANLVVTDGEKRAALGDIYRRAYTRYEAAMLPTVPPFRNEAN